MATYKSASFSESDRPSSETHLNETESATLVATAVDSVDSFHQRQKCERMFELRQLQHGERPVTGQTHREHLREFMDKHVVGRMKEVGNAPSNVDSVEKHRPEAVVVEVQGIIEQRPVSSILQSPAFRRHLENVICGSLASSRRQLARETYVSHPQTWRIPAASTNTVSSQPVSAGAANLSQPVSAGAAKLSQPVSAGAANFSQPVPAVTERLYLVRSESTESVESFLSARSSLEQDIESDNPGHEQLTAAQTWQQESHLASQPTLPTTDPSIVTPAERITWDEISRVQREEMVEEISQLLHSHLVSSTLNSQFRATLELHMQEQITSMGLNGQAVQEFIHTLPRTGVPRNDFSHLGIDVLHEHENWDNISVTSISAHSVPYVQTNTYLGREIQSLRSQMNEMKGMLKLTLDLQMDIQRAIRQEVAAVLSEFSDQGAAGMTVPTLPVSDTHCLVCLDCHTDSVLYQCGHMCVCYLCGRDLLSRGHKCPVCRAPIKDIIRAYKTNVD